MQYQTSTMQYQTSTMDCALLLVSDFVFFSLQDSLGHDSVVPVLTEEVEDGRSVLPQLLPVQTPQLLPVQTAFHV